MKFTIVDPSSLPIIISSELKYSAEYPISTNHYPTFVPPFKGMIYNDRAKLAMLLVYKF